MSKGRVLRFAVGTPDEPYSAIWRCKTHQNDVYLGANSQLMGVFKISLHRGAWLGAFTSESKHVLVDKGTRTAMRWDVPADWRTGWKKGPQVLVPQMSVGPRLKGMDSVEGVTWVRAPDRDEIVALLLHIVGPSVSAEEVEQQLPDDVIIGSVPLANHGRVWVSSRKVPFDGSYRTTCENLRAENVFTIASDPRPGGVAGEFFWVSTAPDGAPTVTDLPPALKYKGKEQAAAVS